jgi:type VI secretion system protein ImpE
MDPKQLLAAGKLAEAIEALVAVVKKKPPAAEPRGLLCELLVLAGELERADKQLDLIAHQQPEAAVWVSLMRQLIRAEVQRGQFFAEGRVPEFLGEPGPVEKLCLEASIHLREGADAQARELLEKAESERAPLAVTVNGTPCDDFRDLDDLTAAVFEVLTSTGKYYWVPQSRVVSATFAPPERPIDLCWRRVHMEVEDGPDGEVYVPVTYCRPGAELTDALRLGRATEWVGDGPVRGVGQREFLAGDAGLPVMDLREIRRAGADA